MKILLILLFSGFCFGKHQWPQSLETFIINERIRPLIAWENKESSQSSQLKLLHLRKEMKRQRRNRKSKMYLIPVNKKILDLTDIRDIAPSSCYQDKKLTKRCFSQIKDFSLRNNIQFLLRKSHLSKPNFPSQSGNFSITVLLPYKLQETSKINKDYLFRYNFKFIEDIISSDLRDFSFKDFKKSKIDNLYRESIVSRRFINTPDWEKKISEVKGASPKDVYDLKAWKSWSEVTKSIQNKNDLFSIEELAKWKGKAISETVFSMFRKGKSQYGKLHNMSFDRQLKEKHIYAKQNIFQRSDLKLKWKPTLCQENINKENVGHDLRRDNAECADLYHDYQRSLLTSTNDYDKNQLKNLMEGIEKGRLFNNDIFNFEAYYSQCWPVDINQSPFAKQESEDLKCGIFYYPDYQLIPNAIEEVIVKANTLLKSAPHQNSDLLIESYVMDAVKIQRQFIALHPFQDGNGRTSRWIFDHLLSHVDLYPLNLVNMNFDMSLTLSEYKRELMISGIYTQYVDNACKRLKSEHCKTDKFFK